MNDKLTVLFELRQARQSVVNSLLRLLAGSKRPYPVYALKRLENRIKRICWSLQCIQAICFSGKGL